MREKALAKILIIYHPEKSDGSYCKKIQIKNLKFQYYYAKNIKEAIKIVLEKPIDGILSDYQLEDGDAIELLEALSNLSARMIPTIILAEEQYEKMGITLFRKGARDFLVKDKENNYRKRIPLTLDRIIKEEIRYRERTRLKRNNEAVLTAVSDGVLGLNLKGYITFANPAAAIYLKEPFEFLIGKSIEDYAHRIDSSFYQGFIQGMKQVRASNQPAVLGQYILMPSNSDQPCVAEVSLTPVFNELLHLEGFVLSFRDISEEKFFTDEVKQMSIEDDLTGLFNRKAFIRRLEHVIAYCNRYQTKCAVLFIDLDGFKNINDALGHNYGDELLLKVADRVQSVIRKSDILARVGGDEFMVLLTHINNSNEAAKVAVKINRALTPPIEIQGKKYYITASIGISLYPHDTQDAKKLVQYADFAMSIVKKSGKNNYQYYKPDLNLEAERAVRLAHDLRMAISSDQLELHFHPQVKAKNGMLVGFEALIRWNHPELGLISPRQFIPLAEEMGFITEIGQWVFKKSLEAYATWKKNGLTNVSLSVNVSVNELLSKDYVDNIVKIFEDFEIDPNSFQFEITESIFAQDASLIISKLHHLKQIGFQLAMDDFGTGYSCLSYLKDLPIDIIKIDRSFVMSLSYSKNERHKALIGAIIDLAKRLDMATLAEGVETQEQADFLSSLGCEYLQGYYIAKPMPFIEATNFMRKHMSIRRGAKVYYLKKK